MRTVGIIITVFLLFNDKCIGQDTTFSFSFLVDSLGISVELVATDSEKILRYEIVNKRKSNIYIDTSYYSYSQNPDSDFISLSQYALDFHEGDHEMFDLEPEHKFSKSFYGYNEINRFYINLGYFNGPLENILKYLNRKEYESGRLRIDSEIFDLYATEIILLNK